MESANTYHGNLAAHYRAVQARLTVNRAARRPGHPPRWSFIPKTKKPPLRQAAILTLVPAKNPLQDLIEIVAKAHGITWGALRSRARTGPITAARKHLIHVIHHEYPSLGLVETGRLIGGFHYTSVLYDRKAFAKIAPSIAREIRLVDEVLGKAA